MKKHFFLAAALASALILSACGSGGGDSPATNVATSNVVLAADASNGRSVARAIDDEVFTFSAVQDFGTNATTTVSVNADGTATPTFTITEAGSGNATGELSFASCIFRVTASTFPASSPLAQGKTVTINPCQVNVNTAGANANAQAQERSATLQLRNAVSLGLTVTVNINNGGNITINGEPSGTVTLQAVTGAS